MAMSNAEGWAIIENGRINVRTVSPTRRAAIVNFLVVERGILVMDSATDEQIEQKWKQMRSQAVVTEIVVTEARK
jgi:hypothetical protein